MSSTSDPADEGLTPEDVRAFVRSRRMQERLLHMAYYQDETPGESMALGLLLSEAAAKSRGEDPDRAP